MSNAGDPKKSSDCLLTLAQNAAARSYQHNLRAKHHREQERQSCCEMSALASEVASLNATIASLGYALIVPFGEEKNG